jgi:hypothetical protein
MKRKDLFLIAAVSLILFASCPVELPENTGKIIVQNNSTSPIQVITDVWLHETGSTEWINSWHGECEKDAEISFTTDPGTYDVRIKVLQAYIIPSFYETGYHQSIKLDNKASKFIIFDGTGIYDMESQ